MPISSTNFTDPRDNVHVYLNGELLGSIVEADADKGYVDQMVKKVSADGWIHERVRRYGDVRVVWNGQNVVAVHHTGDL